MFERLKTQILMNHQESNRKCKTKNNVETCSECLDPVKKYCLLKKYEVISN